MRKTVKIEVKCNTALNNFGKAEHEKFLDLQWNTAIEFLETYERIKVRRALSEAKLTVDVCNSNTLEYIFTLDDSNGRCKVDEDDNVLKLHQLDLHLDTLKMKLKQNQGEEIKIVSIALIDVDTGRGVVTTKVEDDAFIIWEDGSLEVQDIKYFNNL